MGKRHRSRRQRRFVPRSASTAPERPAEREDRTVVRDVVRPRLARAPGVGRAIGQPSAGLLRAATVEYGYVMKDFRRIGLVAGGALALLGIASVVVNTLVK